MINNKHSCALNWKNDRYCYLIYGGSCDDRNRIGVIKVAQQYKNNSK